MSSTEERTILLAGYGWFRSIPDGETNSAEQIAHALDGEIIRAGGRSARVVSIVVPVVWERAFPPIEEAAARLAPDIILALGMGVATASVPHYQRLHRFPIVIFIITAVTLGFFVQELGSTSAATVISIFILIFASISVYNIMTGGDSVEM